jgi:GAF domain-containing protein
MPAAGPAIPSSDGILSLRSRPARVRSGLIELARTFAGYAAVAIANADLYLATATLAENMRRAMETRAVIEQAKGIIIAQQHCTPSTPSNCSPGYPRPPTANSATAPPTSSPPRPRTPDACSRPGVIIPGTG